MKRNQHQPWTDAMRSRLTELVAWGMPYRDIAERMMREFGTYLSKDACVGMAFRMKLPKRTVRGQPKVKTSDLPPPPPEPARPFAVVFRDRPKPHPGMIGIEHLTSDTCRWPHGDTPPLSYCGKQTHQGGPYCREHAERSYPSITKRVIRPVNQGETA